MQLAHLFIYGVAQLFDVLPVLGRNEDRLLVQFGHPRLFQFLQRDVFTCGRRQVVGFFVHPSVGVDLVENHQHGLVGGLQFLLRLVHHLNLFFEVGVGDVNHMDEQIGLAHLVERAFERINKVGGQFADETYGVGKQEGQVFHHHLTNRGVERGKKFVFGKDVALGQQVHDSALSHVGIANQRSTDKPSSVFTLCGFLLVNLDEALLQQGDALKNDSAVHFQLRLTRTAESHASLTATRARAAALTLKVRPESLQAGQHIAVLSQFHLRLGIGRLGTHGKDVEDERGAVENLHL